MFGVPCLTLRSNTERPVTCDVGTKCAGRLRPAGNPPCGICRLERRPSQQPDPRKMDGRAAERIGAILLSHDLLLAPPQAKRPKQRHLRVAGISIAPPSHFRTTRYR